MADLLTHKIDKENVTLHLTSVHNFAIETSLHLSDGTYNTWFNLIRPSKHTYPSLLAIVSVPFGNPMKTGDICLISRHMTGCPAIKHASLITCQYFTTRFWAFYEANQLLKLLLGHSCCCCRCTVLCLSCWSGNWAWLLVMGLGKIGHLTSRLPPKAVGFSAISYTSSTSSASSSIIPVLRVSNNFIAVCFIMYVMPTMLARGFFRPPCLLLCCECHHGLGTMMPSEHHPFVIFFLRDNIKYGVKRRQRIERKHLATDGRERVIIQAPSKIDGSSLPLPF